MLRHIAKACLSISTRMILKFKPMILIQWGIPEYGYMMVNLRAYQKEEWLEV